MEFKAIDDDDDDDTGGDNDTQSTVFSDILHSPTFCLQCNKAHLDSNLLCLF